MDACYCCALTWFCVGLVLLILGVVVSLVWAEADWGLLSGFGLFTLAVILTAAGGYAFFKGLSRREKMSTLGHNLDWIYRNGYFDQSQLAGLDPVYLLSATDATRGSMNPVLGQEVPASGLDPYQVYAKAI